MLAAQRLPTLPDSSSHSEIPRNYPPMDALLTCIITKLEPIQSNYADSDLTQISDDKNSKLGFMEHKDGTPFTPIQIKAVRKAARQSFATLLEEGRAPPSWSHASSRATNIFRKDLLGEHPELGLCANHWKVDAVATEVYSQWSRNRKDR
ncbi:hypothetical protein B0H17DRAFT_1140110 [Mycena rosella]|uniref:Uncharacterized protein n=1 Tax=Mycena rosella TaxID=1033263 RepID=A0AAD7D444_MYCRO|nr:hypothetical protein B0H17DRAFT_1140110 [Mycena rosella]